MRPIREIGATHLLATGLYDPGFEDWDHLPAGYRTDYLIALVALVCAAVTLQRSSQAASADPAVRPFLIFASMLALAFGGGGVTHHMLDVYFKKGETMGRTWNEANSGWMYPWLVTSLIGIASAATVLIAFSRTSFAGGQYTNWVNMGAYGLGGLAMGYEVYLMVVGNIDMTGMVVSMVTLAFGLPSLVLVAVGVYQKGKEHGTIFVAGGEALWLFGFCFLIFLVPDACKKAGSYREGCPFPEAFNQNAIFHSIIIFSVLLFFAATQQGSTKGSEPLAHD